MNIHELIHSRGSIRKYKTTPIPLETVLKIIESARRAPSATNRQCWRFVIIDNPTQKKLVAKACGQGIIAKACEDAPYLIFLCASPSESGVKDDMEFFLFDSALAMQNLLIAAQGEGLSTCIVGWFDEVLVREALQIPDNIKPLVFTPLGYRNEDIKPLPRKKRNEVVFHNFWGKPVIENNNKNDTGRI